MKYNKSRLAKVYKKEKQKSDLLIAIRILLLSFVFCGITFGTLKYYKNNKNEMAQAQKTETEIQPTEPPAQVEVVKNADTNELTVKINDYLQTVEGTYGISLKSTDNDINIGINNLDSFVAASTVKVPVALYIFNQIEKGAILPESTLAYLGADYEGGTGIIQSYSTGRRFTVTNLLELMIKNSDNIALNILFRNYGRANTQAYIENGGYQGINLLANTTTPEAINDMLVDTYNQGLLSQENTNMLLNYMENSIVPERINNGVPAEVPVYHKIGTNSEAISDIAIIDYKNKPYVLTVYSSGIVNESAASQTIKNISSMVYDFISNNY